MWSWFTEEAKIWLDGFRWDNQVGLVSHEDHNYNLSLSTFTKFENLEEDKGPTAISSDQVEGSPTGTQIFDIVFGETGYSTLLSGSGSIGTFCSAAVGRKLTPGIEESETSGMTQWLADPTLVEHVRHILMAGTTPSDNQNQTNDNFPTTHSTFTPPHSTADGGEQD